MEKKNYQMHGQVSQDSPYWTKGHLMGTHGPGWDLWGNKQPLVQTMYGQKCGSTCPMQQKAKQRWAIEKQNLDNARQLRRIFLIEPNDEEFKLTTKAARRKLEVPMPAAMPCKIPIKSSGETRRNIGKRKTKYSCIVDADESTRPRLEGAGHKPHQGHITTKGTNSMTLCSLVHKFIPLTQALKKNPDAKAAPKESPFQIDVTRTTYTSVCHHRLRLKIQKTLPVFLKHECESCFGTVNRNGCHRTVREDSRNFCTCAQVPKVQPWFASCDKQDPPCYRCKLCCRLAGSVRSMHCC